MITSNIFFTRDRFHKNLKILGIGLAVVLFSISVSAQQNTIKGKVTDKLNNPLIGVSVGLVGSTEGALTDENGNYSLKAPPSSSLRFSYIGYEPKIIKIGSQNRIDVVLDAKEGSLDEVVVVAYGEQKKASVTGSLVSIGPREIKQSPASNLAVGLAGKLPGLTAIERSGQPGHDLSKLYIRGISTPNSRDPLILVDGVERELNYIDPNEIKDITILKDASSTALYGVRGANGVILVTTRRGESGKSHISFTTEMSGNAFTRINKTVGAYDYAITRNLALRNDGLPPEFTAQEIEKYKTGSDPIAYPNTNWRDIILKKLALQQRYNLNVSGGTDKVKYFVNAGYLKQSGQFKTEKDLPYDPDMMLNRYNFRSNIDINLNSSLHAFLNLAGYLEKENTPAGVYATIDPHLVLSDPPSKYIIALMHDLPATLPGPVVPPGYGDASGEPTTTSDLSWPVYGMVNRSGFFSINRTNITATYGMEQDLDFLTKGLSVKAVMSYDTKSSNVVRAQKSFPAYYPVIHHNLKDINGNDSISYRLQNGEKNTPLNRYNFKDYTTKTEFNFYTNYKRSFGKHDVSGLLLFQRRERIINGDLPYNHLGVSGRFTYGFDDRYFVEFDAGYNGSEQFAKGHRFGFFPAFSGAWVVSNEHFFPEDATVSSLKLRGSYGIVGNDGIGGRRFLYLDDIQIGGGGYSPSLGSQAGVPSRVNVNLLGNRNLQWETAKKTNIGVELELFNSLGLIVDLFKEKRDNILITPNTIPSVIGLSSSKLPPINSGIVKNHGYEIQLKYQKSFTDDFTLLTKVNFNYAKDKVVFADEPLLPKDYAYRYRNTGFPLGQQWGYIVEGYFRDEKDIFNSPEQNIAGTPEPGDFKYKDLNGDGVVDEKDEAPIGAPVVPAYTFGASFRITYKNFDLSVLFQGVGQVSTYMNDRYSFAIEHNYLHRHLQSWTEERVKNGDPITYPRLHSNWTGGNQNEIRNTFFDVNAEYIRLKNVELGYFLPDNVADKIGAESIRFYLKGFNILTWDKLPTKDFDPELANIGGSIGPHVYPLNKIYSVGVNVIF